MNPSQPDSKYHEMVVDSSDDIDFFDNGPGDTTPRPRPPYIPLDFPRPVLPPRPPDTEPPPSPPSPPQES